MHGSKKLKSQLEFSAANRGAWERATTTAAFVRNRSVLLVAVARTAATRGLILPVLAVAALIALELAIDHACVKERGA